MPFDEIEMQHIDAWMASRNALGPCPSCGEKDWNLHDRIVFVPTLDNGAIDPVHVFPMLQFFCGNCARVIQFAAAPLGF